MAKTGLQRFPRVPGLINNLAYINLQLGRVTDAREVLQSLPRRVVPHTELIATQGLLHLWEGDIEGARRLYEEAARKASADGTKIYLVK